MLNNLLNFSGISSFYQWVIQGIIIILRRRPANAKGGLSYEHGQPPILQALLADDRSCAREVRSCDLFGVASPRSVVRVASFPTAGQCAQSTGLWRSALLACRSSFGRLAVILVRGLDLSVASLMATVAVLATVFKATSNEAIPLIFVAAIAFSAMVGLVNGFLVVKRGVSPFLATLATMIILQGIRFSYTGGAPISTLPPGMSTLATGRLLGAPINLWTLGLLAVLLGVMLHKSRFGREIRMVGGNPKAARLVGLSPDRVTILCYVICSVCAGIGGLFLLGYVGTVSNWVGQGYELDSIIVAGDGRRRLVREAAEASSAPLMGVAVLIVIANLRHPVRSAISRPSRLLRASSSLARLPSGRTRLSRNR